MKEVQWETRLLGILAAVLIVVGLVSVYGASSLVSTQGGVVGASYFFKQAIGAAIGGLGATIVARTDYHIWQRWAWPLLGATALLLLLPILPFTHVVAPTLNGARRWVNLGFTVIQPSELAKFTIVCWTAMLAAKKGDQLRTFKFGLLPFLVVLFPIIGLVFLEPNLSMALLLTMLAGTVLFAAGARIGHFLLLGMGAAPVLFGAVASAQYRLARVVHFLSSGSAPSEAQSQVHQSLVGIGAGRLIGVGFGQGQQKLGYLPYAYSDFIFSTIAEEWGFLGGLVIILCFAGICWLGLRIARRAPDPFGQFLAVGLTAVIGVTAILHIAVTLAVMPATGITLPLISYGRTSLFVSLAAIGVLVSIGHGVEARRKTGGRRRATAPAGTAK
ncbi:MAG TPA: putative peptidoglycan glycosyltransferase FtsW [Gemmatimonadales bacterium]|nr:putative peptidoglycan glycosyltransferase FtsW [Gemmatimonadales bacterium]